MPYTEIICENAFKLHFDHNDIDTSAKHITVLVDILRNRFPEQILDLIPAYASLTVIVDFPKVIPQKIAKQIETYYLTNHAEITRAEINDSEEKSTVESHTTSSHHILPCYYGPDVAWDTQSIADQASLAYEQVAELHQAQHYRVYALGFSPGFPYLGMVDQRIAMPRRSDPRIFVPQGAVGIAGQQTGIYPADSPGGWNIIGNCPLPLFDINREQQGLSTLNAGDTVRFEAIDQTTFLTLGGVLPK